MPEGRFVVDEGALSLENVAEVKRAESLTALIDQLDALRVSGESIQIMEDWGSVECLVGIDFAETMVNYQVLDRDQSLQLLDLLGRCAPWNRTSAVAPEVVVDGRNYNAEGVAWAREQAILRNRTAVVTTPHRFTSGVHVVHTPAQTRLVDVYFSVSTEDHPGFSRLLYDWEDVPESEFFERARLAFPRNLAGKWRWPGKRLYLGSTRIARAENAGRAIRSEGSLGSGPAVPGPRGAGHLLRSAGLAAGPAVPGRRFRRVLLPGDNGQLSSPRP